MFDVTETGKRIKAIRGNVKQSECAEMLGISRAALSQYENGKRKIEMEAFICRSQQYLVNYT